MDTFARITSQTCKRVEKDAKVHAHIKFEELEGMKDVSSGW